MPATRRQIIYAAALVALVFASRLPQLRSPNLLVDGDECVLGLMAKHLAQLKEFPIFFYGQNYAFSPVEATAVAAGFLPYGVGPVALKLAALALWTAGIVLGFLALSRLVGGQSGFWITAALVLNPVWAVFSMKPGGGYLTSFVAASMLAWVLVRDRNGESIVGWIAAGALTGVIYLAQPLWLPGVLPFVGVALARRRRAGWAIGYAAAALAVIASVKLAAPVVVDGWRGPSIGNGDLFGSVLAVARQIYLYMTGAYYLGWATDSPGPATTTLAVVWCALIPAAALLQLYRLVTRRYCWLSHLLFVSFWTTVIAEWIFLSARDARYMLPLGGLLVPLIGVELVDLAERKLLPRAAVPVLTCVALLLGALSMREFREFNYLWKNPSPQWSEAKRLQQVISYLNVMDVRHVFSMNGMLDSQLVFYSDEHVYSRWNNPTGRYHAYVKEVNRALADGEKVAVVGYTHNSGAPGCWDVPICTGGIENMVQNPSSIFTVDGKYFVYVGADRELLTRLGFRFWD